MLSDEKTFWRADAGWRHIYVKNGGFAISHWITPNKSAMDYLRPDE